MASEKLAHTSLPVTSSSRPKPSLHCEHIYRNHSPNPSSINPSTTSPADTMDSLYFPIAYANKYEWSLPNDVRRLYIDGVDELVGLVPEHFAEAMTWHRDIFALPPPAFEGCSHRIIIIRTDFLPFEGGLPVTRNCKDPLKCCELALERLAFDNCREFPSLSKWAATDFEEREYSPVHMFTHGLRGMRIPTPLRGFLGILTVGVHLNVYSRDRTTNEYRIWVAKRAIGHKYSYSGMLDQIVAGGMDMEDRIKHWMAPFKTLTREAKEEAGLEIEKLGQKVFAPGTDTEPAREIGRVVRSSWVSFFDKKDRKAGKHDEGQLEPGVRIIYDLELINDFCPQGNEPSIEKIMPMNVSQVKESLMEKGKWKPNCGLVMLDFLVRHRLANVQNDTHFPEIVRDLRPDLPFKFADRWNECRIGW